MSKIKKFLPYLLIPLDIFALLAFQNIAQCSGGDSQGCGDGSGMSWIIVMIAALSTGFYLYKRHTANLPLLPFMSASKDEVDNTVSSSPKIFTPLKNKLFFGFISFLLMMSYFVEPYHYTKGSDTPPYAHWAFYTLPILVGLVLITLKDEIKLRLHPFWTPFGLLYAAFAWALVIFDGLPQGALFGYSLFDSIGEGFWFATGLGLMLAFVGLKPLYRRAFYFISLAFFGGLFGSIEFLRQMGVILAQKPIEWGAYLDMTWLAGGYFALYLIVVRLIKDRPPIKTMVMSVAAFILIVAANLILAQGLVSRAFPKDSWLHHWLKGYLPAYNFQCFGTDCNNIVYREPYSFCVNGNGIDRGNPIQFYDMAQSRVTKGCRYELNLDNKTLKIVCNHPIRGVNANSTDLAVVECGNARFEGAYGEGFGGSQFRQKELYE